MSEDARRIWGDIGTMVAVAGTFVADVHSLDAGILVSTIGFCILILSVFGLTDA